MTAKTLEQEAREAAEGFADSVDAETGGTICKGSYMNGYIAAATARDKKIEEARAMAADAIAMTADQANEIGRLKRRNADMELTQRKFGGFMHEKLNEIEELRARVKELIDAANVLLGNDEYDTDWPQYQARVQEAINAFEIPLTDNKNNKEHND